MVLQTEYLCPSKIHTLNPKPNMTILRGKAFRGYLDHKVGLMDRIHVLTKEAPENSLVLSTM